jgi:hypothetical protein
MKFVRTAKYTWKKYKTNKDISKELKTVTTLGKILKFKTRTQHVDRMENIKNYKPRGFRNRV